MSEELRQVLEIVGQDSASAEIRKVQASLAALAKEVQAVGKTISKSFGSDLLKGLQTATTAAVKFGTDLTEGATKAAAAIRNDVTATTELTSALKAAVAEQRGLISGARASASAATASARTATAARTRATTDTIRDVGRVWKIRQASEASELRHINMVKRERANARREAARDAKEAFRQGRHAVRSVNHPALASPGHAAALGAAFGIAAAKTIVERSIDTDTAATRFRMFAVPPGMDAAKETAAAVQKAQLDSIKLGTSAATVLDIQAKAARDGIRNDIARAMPNMIISAAKVMGGDPERLTDTLSEGIQQALSMGLVKDAAGVRRFVNLEAGLSVTAGNTSAKQEQFIASGGLGRGVEMGLGLTDTMAMGALLNSSGARTGLASARFMGSLSQNVPKMHDDYLKASRSHSNTEENRAVRSAPRLLGFASIGEMQKTLLSGPEGLIDFAQRLSKLDHKQRKLILEGYHFGEQGGAMLAEIGESPEKAKAVVARAKELAAQVQSNDYLSEKFRDWQTSLANMLQQIEAGWNAIESAMGDVIKTDITGPFRDWWQGVASEIVKSDLKQQTHRAILGFINGLGFTDLADMLKRLKSSVGSFDVAGFTKGLGEGLRASFDALKSVLGVFAGGQDAVSAEMVGKFATELLSLSFALHAIDPVVSIVGGIASAVLALQAAIGVGTWVANLSGLTGGFKAFLALDLASATAGLAALAGSIGVLVGAISWARSKGALAPPKDASWRGFLDFLDPNLGNMLLGKQPGSRVKDDDVTAQPKTSALSPESYWAKKKAYLHLQSYDGGGFDDLRQGISYAPADAGETTRDAILATAETTDRIRQGIDRVADLLHRASASPINSDGSVGSYGGGGSGASNMRYGRRGSSLGGAPHHGLGVKSHHGSGPYRGTPVSDAPYNGKTIDGLTEEGTKQYAAILGHRESGNRYNITNPYGFVGRWQMGAAALKENGYVTTGNNRALKSDSVWTGKGGIHSLSEFLANKNGVQDQEFSEYTNRHFAQLKKAGVIRDGMSQADIAGWLAAAHLKGVGGATALARGHDNVDANGTSASSYRRMMQGVGSKPLESPSNPVSVKPAPSAKMTSGEVAGHVVTKTRPTRDDARPGSNISADGSTHTYHFNVTNPDPHKAARVIREHLEATRSRYSDQEVTV